MPKPRMDVIEKEENRVTAELMLKVIGNRTYREAAEDAGLKDPSALSYICRGKVRPTPKIIQMMTVPSAKPQNGISYSDYMLAAGYVEQQMIEEIYSDNAYFEETDDGDASEAIDDANQSTEAKLDYFENRRSFSLAGRKNESQNEEMKERRNKAQQIMETYNYVIITKAAKIGSVQIASNSSPDNRGGDRWTYDQELVINSISTKINIWKLDYQVAFDRMAFRPMYRDGIIAKLMWNGLVEPNAKISIVVNTQRAFDLFARYKNQIPYRGNLSIIWIDPDERAVKAEEYLSHYDLDDTSDDFYIC